MASPGSLKAIWDRQTRRGVDLVELLSKNSTSPSPYLSNILKNIDDARVIRANIKALRKSKGGAMAISSSRNKLKAIVAERDVLVELMLAKVAEAINASSFRLQLRRVGDQAGKEFYRMGGDFAAQYFAAKQLQRDLSTSFALKMSSRRLICRQLIASVDDGFPKSIVRLDVESFYDHVEHQTLLVRLEKSRLLPHASLRMIRMFLSDFSRLSSHPAATGLPRGHSLSAYLAEVSMLDFDRDMVEHPDVIYYARFVDDIVAVYASGGAREPSSAERLAQMESKLAEIGLTVSSKADKRFDLAQAKGEGFPPFYYLGYEIRRVGYTTTNTSGNPKTEWRTEIRLSPSRLEKMRIKLHNAFGAYTRANSPSGKSAKMLARRVQFMTGNTRLLHNKRGAFAGVYYSNEYITELEQLDSLDAELRALSSALPKHVKDKVDRESFRRGFVERTPRRWTADQMRGLRTVWGF
jgi:hypothetical protein